jgi:hypothetical protein
MKLARILVLAGCALGATSLSACAVAVEPAPPSVVPVDQGTLTVQWLVAGGSDAALCVRYGLVDTQVVVYDASGAPVSRDTTSCSDFRVTIPLDEGTYTADVTMLDRRGRAVSSTKTLEAIEIIAGTDLAINLDFPLESLR